MRIIISVLTLALWILGATALADDVPGTTETWKTNGTMAVVLAEAADEIPDMTVEGYNGSAELDQKATSCSAEVFRPARLAGSLATETNYLQCDLVNKDGSTGTLHLSLAKALVRSWGNRPSEDYWERNNLPRPFQIRNLDVDETDYNLKLFRALRAQHKAENPMVETMFICGPNGHLCSRSYSLIVTPGEYAVYLECSVETEGEDIYGTRCWFNFP